MSTGSSSALDLFCGITGSVLRVITGSMLCVISSASPSRGGAISPGSMAISSGGSHVDGVAGRPLVAYLLLSLVLCIIYYLILGVLGA